MAVEIEREEIRMGEMIYRLFAPNLIVVCVDERKGNDCAGKFWQQYEKRSCPFQTIGDLFFQMEDLFDDWNFPQSSNRPRTFAEEIGMEEAELAGKRTTRIKRGKRADLSDLHDGRGLAELERLLIGVDADKLYPFDVLVDHAVHCIVACAANADYDDLCSIIVFVQFDL